MKQNMSASCWNPYSLQATCKSLYVPLPFATCEFHTYKIGSPGSYCRWFQLHKPLTFFPLSGSWVLAVLLVFLPFKRAVIGYIYFLSSVTDVLPCCVLAESRFFVPALPSVRAGHVCHSSWDLQCAFGPAWLKKNKGGLPNGSVCIHFL